VVVKGTDPIMEYVFLMPYYWTANLAEAFLQSMACVNRIRNGTCVNRVVLELWKEQSMY
jgi:hypothetical protein